MVETHAGKHISFAIFNFWIFVPFNEAIYEAKLIASQALKNYQ
jgi:hypothetical protein